MNILDEILEENLEDLGGSDETSSKQKIGEYKISF